jgi:hypothetical protein
MPHSTTISSSPYQVDPWVALNRDMNDEAQLTFVLETYQLVEIYFGAQERTSYFIYFYLITDAYFNL